MFDLPVKAIRASELDRQLTAPGAWDDPLVAGHAAREASEMRQEVEGWAKLEARARDLVELAGLASGDVELERQLEAEADGLTKELQGRELELLFGDPYAFHNAVISISAGQGGI
ncbi:MAG: PCRF domain-containing protein, partial [Candidatus Dormibacteraceae bacterium]